MRDIRNHDDLQLGHVAHVDPDDSWVDGEIEVTEERPSTGLRGDHRQRNWMLVGLGGGAIVTAALVLVLSQGAGAEPVAKPAPTLEPAVQVPVVEEPAELAPAPVAPQPPPTRKANSGKTVLASTSTAGVAPTPAPQVSPTPAPSPSPSSLPTTPSERTPAPSPASGPSKPTPSTPAAKPTPAATPVPTPAPTPTPTKPVAPALPSDEQASPPAASDLPDVEGWDESDSTADEPEPESVTAPEPAEPTAAV